MIETTLTASRTITDADIDACAELTGDFGAHHIAGVPDGRMAQGLLTLMSAPLLNEPDAHVVEFSMTFLAPVFAGETVTSSIEITDSRDVGDGQLAHSFTISVANDKDAVVLRGEGVVRTPAERSTW